MFVSKGLSPAVVADKTFVALEERRFYVIMNPEYKQAIEMRHRQIEEAITGEPGPDVEIATGAFAYMESESLT
jgi:hypothetical protein